MHSLSRLTREPCSSWEVKTEVKARQDDLGHTLACAREQEEELGTRAPPAEEKMGRILTTLHTHARRKREASAKVTTIISWAVIMTMLLGVATSALGYFWGKVLVFCGGLVVVLLSVSLFTLTEIDLDELALRSPAKSRNIYAMVSVATLALTATINPSFSLAMLHLVVAWYWYSRFIHGHNTWWGKPNRIYCVWVTLITAGFGIGCGLQILTGHWNYSSLVAKIVVFVLMGVTPLVGSMAMWPVTASTYIECRSRRLHAVLYMASILMGIALLGQALSITYVLERDGPSLVFSSGRDMIFPADIVSCIVVGCSYIVVTLLVMRHRRDAMRVIMAFISEPGLLNEGAFVIEVSNSCTPEELVRQGRGALRRVPMSWLTLEVFLQLNYRPESIAEEIRENIAEPCDLDDIDFFISHSHQDSPILKADRVKAICMQFQKAHGRQPYAWIEDICMPTEDTRHYLPVIMGACQHMLILAGPTYVESLRCMWEIYVFFAMHKEAEQKVTMLPLGGNREEVLQSLSAVSVEDLLFFCRPDERALCNSINSAHGGESGFQVLIHEVATRIHRHCSC